MPKTAHLVSRDIGSWHHYPLKLVADPGRVVIRPFNLAWQASGADISRVERLLAKIEELDAASVEQTLDAVMSDFDHRHWLIDKFFDRRFERLCQIDASARDLPPGHQRLAAAFFAHEYSVAAAALMNPSIVLHPDQSGCDHGQVRFIMSARAVGEGHISSVVFYEGVIDAGGEFSLSPTPQISTTAYPKTPITGETHTAIVHRDIDSPIGGMVLFPVTPAQANGIEDMRLVRMEEEDGSVQYVGTYTAYDGRTIRSELMLTDDFQSMALTPVDGIAGRNKGLALFPRRINGRYAMIGRQDGQNIYYLESDDLALWRDDGRLIAAPEHVWELVQIGNCGSPIECDAGWILLTHGVGPMRKYSLGAMLLDRDDPSRVLARTFEPILTPSEVDREGYVPNVVYTCGALKVGDRLFIPYGIADSAIGFLNVEISALLAKMR